MKNVILFLLLQGVVFTACNSFNKTAEEEKVKKVIDAYFKAIQSNDYEQMKANTTNDYLLFESGKVWNNDSLWNEIQKFKDNTIRFSINSHSIEIDQRFAHVVYFNHGDIYQNDSLMSRMDWIESATLKKIDGQWKIFFLHSTQRD
jgi:ketosteroid isomerase-like protein